MKSKLKIASVYIVLLYLVIMVTYIAFKPKPIYDIHYQPRPLSAISMVDGKFMVPYYFNEMQIPPSDRDKPFLVGHITGEGLVRAITFHSGYYGIAVGYSVDDSEIFWINNGHCLVEWGADSPSAIGLPVILLSWKNKNDLEMAVNAPITFKQSFKLYFCNSDANAEHPIKSLHVYGYFKDFDFGDNNKLKL